MNDSETERHTREHTCLPSILVVNCHGAMEKTKRSVKNLKSVAKRVSLTDVSQFVLDEQSVIRDPQDVCTRQSGVEERERDRFERGT